MDYEALFAACTRIRSGHRSAFDDLHELAVGELFVHTKAQFRDVDPTVIDDAIADILLKFATTPDCCRAKSGAEAFAFFRTSVRNKVLNAIRDMKRRSKYEMEAGDDAVRVALLPPEVSREDEEAEQQAQIVALEQRFSDPRDLEVFRLQLSGERSTAVFARVLGVDHLSAAEQAHQVKKAKDRIMKFLKRKVRGT